MISLSGRLNELNEVSPDIARKLVGTLFEQTGTLIVGGLVFMVPGLSGFFGTGSWWYLAATILTGSICATRVWLSHYYAKARLTASPVVWAKRSLIGAWASGASWGLWSAALVFEPDRSLAIGILTTIGISVIGAAVRNATVPIVAVGQICLASVPMVLSCVLTGNGYMLFFAVSVCLNIVAALKLTQFLHAQTLRLLRQDEEKSHLVRNLEIAQQDMAVLNRHLETLAATDALTGIANRRMFDLQSEREWRRAAREGKTISMLLLDVDHFKKFNDFYGHPAGDQCLREVAGAISSTLGRPGDVVARYGGEEFAVVLPDTDLAGAARTGADILNALEGLSMPHGASDLGRVTVSIGAASATPSPGMPVCLLTERADAALYAAKRNGRNRVQLAANVAGTYDSSALPPVSATVT